MDNRPIGVFDSGVGGLTVLKELIGLLPFEDYVYFGDTARVPYGTKSKKTITSFACEIVEYLLKKNVKMIVAACNTVSSNSMAFLRKKYQIPIIGVIRPGVDLAFSVTVNKRIGVIGTQSTVNSHKYKTLLLKKHSKLTITELACPLFVPLVEEGLFNGRVVQQAIAHYLPGLKKKKIDTLILGCTHYPLLAGPLQKFFGRGVTLVNSGNAVSLKVRNLLKKQDIHSSRRRKGKIYFFISDPSAGFLKKACPALGLRGLKSRIVSFD